MRHLRRRSGPRPYALFGAWLLAAFLLGCPWRAEIALADTGEWSKPVHISGDTPGGWWPDVAADDSGTVHVVWNAGFADSLAAQSLREAGKGAGEPGQAGFPGRPGESVAGLYYSRWNGATWTRPTDIAVIWYGHALRSSLAAENGRVHLIYKGFGGLTRESVERSLRGLGPSDLWYTTSDADRGEQLSSWRAPWQLTRSTEGYYSDIAIDSRGIIHAIWTESQKGSWGIYYTRSSDGGRSWSRRVPLDGENYVWWYRAHLKVDDRDRLHVVWEVTDPQHLGNTRGAFYARSADGGESWVQARFPKDLPPYPEYSGLGPGPQQPTVGVDGKGDTLFIFRDPTSNQILYSTSSDGSMWTAPASIPGISSGVQRPYDVYDTVTDSAGRVHLVVAGRAADPGPIVLIHLEWDGSGWGSPQVIADSPLFPEFPRLAISNGNRLHLVWFTGDRASMDRNPVAIWYSTAETNAPASRRQVSAAGPVDSPPLDPRAAQTSLVVTGSQEAGGGDGAKRSLAGDWVPDLHRPRPQPILFSITSSLLFLVVVVLVRRVTATLTSDRRDGERR